MSTDSDNSEIINRTLGTSRPKRTWREYLVHYLPAGRSWRYYFTREKIVEQLRLLVWVIPLTLVIWVYAERGQIIEANGVGVTVRIYSSDATIFVDSSSNVTLKLIGPQEAIDKLKEKLASQKERGGLPIDLGHTRGRGANQAVDILDRLQNSTVFKDTPGVSIVEAQPSQVQVDIDDIKSIDLPVEIPPDVMNLSNETRFDPPRITVKGPSLLLAKDNLHVYAKVGSVRDPGDQPPRVVPVELSSNDTRLVLSTSQVTATLVVQASDVQYTIDSVPIHVQGSSDILNNNIITVNNGVQSMTQLQVAGPPNQIERLRNKDFLPYAILDIAHGDADRDGLSRELRYELPPGVKVSPNDADASKPVPFKLTSR